MNEHGTNAEETAAMPPPEGRLLALDEAFNPEALSGTRSPVFADRLAQQVVGCQFLPADGELLTQRVTAAVTALKELAPRNAAEGMLAAQMVAVHNIGLEYLTRAMAQAPGDKAAEINTRQGARLLGLYLRQLDQLGRQRGRRRQSLRIEHEHDGEDGRVRVRAEEERVR